MSCVIAAFGGILFGYDAGTSTSSQIHRHSPLELLLDSVHAQPKEYLPIYNRCCRLETLLNLLRQLAQLSEGWAARLSPPYMGSMCTWAKVMTVHVQASLEAWNRCINLLPPISLRLSMRQTQTSTASGFFWMIIAYGFTVDGHCVWVHRAETKKLDASRKHSMFLHCCTCYPANLAKVGFVQKFWIPVEYSILCSASSAGV